MECSPVCAAREREPHHPDKLHFPARLERDNRLMLSTKATGAGLWVDQELKDHILAIEQKLDQLVLKVNSSFLRFSPTGEASGGEGPMSSWRARTAALASTAPAAEAQAAGRPPEGAVPLPVGDAAAAAPSVETQTEAEDHPALVRVRSSEHSQTQAVQTSARLGSSRPSPPPRTSVCSEGVKSTKSRTSDGSNGRVGMFVNLEERRASAGLPAPSKPTFRRTRSNNGGIAYFAWKRQLSNMRISDYSSKGRQLSCFAESMHLFLEDGESSQPAMWYARLWPLVVMASVVTCLLQMVEDTFLYGIVAAVMETTFDSIFLFEVLLRLAVNPTPRSFFFRPLNLIDVLAAAALPVRVWMGFVFEQPVHVDKSAITVLLLCFLPVIRSLKLLRRWEKVHLLTKAFSDVLEALPVLLFPLMILTMFFASLIFFVEPTDNIGSLWKAFWLTIVTMTTVGYGDAIPKSAAGSCIVGILVMFSVLYMAMPIGIVGQAFTEVWQDRDKVLLMHRTRKRFAAWGYTATDAMMLFDAFDVQRRGVMTIHEFRVMVNKLRIGLPDARIAQLFRLFDKNDNGWIDEKEFLNALFPEKVFEEELEQVDPPEDRKDLYSSEKDLVSERLNFAVA